MGLRGSVDVLEGLRCVPGDVKCVLKVPKGFMRKGRGVPCGLRVEMGNPIQSR